MKINVDKSKALVVGKDRIGSCSGRVSGEEMQEVDKFNSLVVMIDG